MKELFNEVMKSVKNVSIAIIKAIKSSKKVKGTKTQDNSEE